MRLPFSAATKDELNEKMVDENENNAVEESKEDKLKEGGVKAVFTEIVKEKVDQSSLHPKNCCLNPKKCCVLQNPCTQKIVEAVKSKFN